MISIDKPGMNFRITDFVRQITRSLSKAAHQTKVFCKLYAITDLYSN